MFIGYEKYHESVKAAMENGVKGKDLINHIKDVMGLKVNKKLEECFEDIELYDKVKDELKEQIKEILSIDFHFNLWYNVPTGEGMTIKYTSWHTDDEDNVVGELNSILFKDFDEDEVVDSFNRDYKEEDMDIAITEFMKKYIEYGRQILKEENG